MGAAGFGTLVGYFTDRTVVTYDPRGVERSRSRRRHRVHAREHADDLHRLIAALDAGPVDMFASSGGAVNALALVARHPEQVRTLVAHEPPAAQVLPDREEALAACRDIHETYQRERLGPGDGEVHRARHPQGSDPGRLRRPARAGSGRCSGCRPRTTAPGTTRCSGRTWSRAPTTSPTSTPCARLRPASSSPPEPNRRASWPAARRWPWPNGSGRSPSSSPATTAASSAASTARRASPDGVRGQTARGPRAAESAPAAQSLSAARHRSHLGHTNAARGSMR